MPSIPQTFQTLRCFATVAREGSVSAAAHKLHLSQPAVSLQIKNLEDLIGLMLFHRTSKGLTLTPEGTRLLIEAEKTVAALDGFGQQVDLLKGTQQEVLRVGTILDPEFIHLSSFLKGVVNTAPKTELRLIHCMSDEVLVKLARREIDVGYCLELPPSFDAGRDQVASANERLSIKSKFRFGVLREVAYRVAVPAAWADQVRGKDWRGLASLPWVLTPEFSAHSWLLASVFNPLGVTPQRVATSDRESPMLDLVESGIGLSLIRDSIAEAEAAARGFAIADGFCIECQLRFASLESRMDEQLIAGAWDAVRQAWPALVWVS